MSTHQVDIIEIGEILPHPNPEYTRIELTHVLGWQCCIPKGIYKKGDPAIYIEPDFLVPLAHPSFAFLKKEADTKTQERIRVRKYGGAISQGLIISVPPELSHLPVGTNVIEQLGIERYEPPIPMSSGGMFVGAPSSLYAPKHDVESMQRYYKNVFVEGEIVIATEKLDGSSARFVWAQDKDGNWKQFAGTHTNWIGEDDKNWWWTALRQNPEIGRWCQNHPNILIYGELFGQTQRRMPYGSKTNDIWFAPFAILDKNQWIDYDECQRMIAGYSLQWVPLVWRGPFNFEKMLELAEGNSLVPTAHHLREGIVVIPEHERMDQKIGRVMLKVVSNEYLEKIK